MVIMERKMQNKKSGVKILVAAIGCFDWIGHKKAANDNFEQFCLPLLPANENSRGSHEPES